MILPGGIVRSQIEKSIILNTLDDMPWKQQEYRNLLEVQNIKSLMAVPLIAKDEVWGYMGIDMVRCMRSWSNIDLQCFSSLLTLSVFVSNCESRNYRPKKIVLL